MWMCISSILWHPKSRYANWKQSFSLSQLRVGSAISGRRCHNFQLLIWFGYSNCRDFHATTLIDSCCWPLESFNKNAGFSLPLAHSKRQDPGTRWTHVAGHLMFWWWLLWWTFLLDVLISETAMYSHLQMIETDNVLSVTVVVSCFQQRCQKVGWVGWFWVDLLSFCFKLLLANTIWSR